MESWQEVGDRGSSALPPLPKAESTVQPWGSEEDLEMTTNGLGRELRPQGQTEL